MTCQIWCEGCFCADAERLHRSVYRGQVTARGGRLKVDAACSVCRELLSAGSYAEAVTFHGIAVRFSAWEGEFLKIGAARGLVGWEGAA